MLGPVIVITDERFSTAKPAGHFFRSSENISHSSQPLAAISPLFLPCSSKFPPHAIMKTTTCTTRGFSTNRPSIIRTTAIAAICFGYAIFAVPADAKNIDHTWGFPSSGNGQNLATTSDPAIADSFHIYTPDPSDSYFRWWQQNTTQINVIQSTVTPSFVARKLNDGILMGSNEKLGAFTLSLDSNWLYGGATDPRLKSFIGLLDANGNGVLAEVIRGSGSGTQGTTGGRLNIYSLTSATASSIVDPATWGTPLQSGTFDNSNETGVPNAKQITFSFNDSTLSLSVAKADGSSLAGSSISFTMTDPAFSGFTTLLLGNMSPGREEQRFYNIHLTGTAIPEPATSAIGLGLLALVFVGAWSRLRRVR